MIFLNTSELRAQILPRGATLAGFWFHPGARHSLVLGTPDGRGFDRELTYAGAIVGPVANRLRGASVTINGVTHGLPANDNGNTLHSGPLGLHATEWAVTEQSDDQVILQADLADGTCGLPGNRRFSASYSLLPGATLSLEITATTDRDTLINPAHHPYWCLDAGPGIPDHRLQVMAETWLPTDDATLPRGTVAPVAGSDYDFARMRPVPVDRPLDASLCLSPQQRPDPQKAAILTGPNGLTMTIDTTEPGLQIYNGSGLPEDGPALHDGRRLQPFAGLALEPQGWPDAPAHADFPSILLPAGEIYRQVTRYHFSF
ncbi:aldose epimerase family protein [uncultured Roseobacter sp.]|uniref:aldose epimerase family protein n=1 Tax=uncultured Roseobacter sp. TaxID=114847 RepID=UPI00262AAF5B|nr:aldose epimerase family protein [uncultured Roseobacter sp.]